MKLTMKKGRKHWLFISSVLCAWAVLAVAVLVLVGGCMSAPTPENTTRAIPTEGRTTTTFPLGSQQTEWKDLVPSEASSPTGVDAAIDAQNLLEAQGNVAKAAEDKERAEQALREAQREEALARKLSDFHECRRDEQADSSLTDSQREANVCFCLRSSGIDDQRMRNTWCPGPPVTIRPVENSTPPVVLIDGGEFDRQVERVEGKGKEWANDGAEKAFASVNKHMQWEALSDGCKDAAGDVYAAMDPDYTGSWNWLVNLTANPKALDTWSGLQDFVDMNTQDGGTAIIALDGKCP